MEKLDDLNNLYGLAQCTRDLSSFFFGRPVLIIQFGHSLTVVMENKEEGLTLGVIA